MLFKFKVLYSNFKTVLTLTLKCVRIIIRLKIQKYIRKSKNKYGRTNFILQLIQNIQNQKMNQKPHSKFQKQESQFRIEEISRKKKGNIQNKSHRYSVITYEKRIQLINLAASKGYSISRAARQLGIKPSTGKFIVKCYRDNGKIMKKTMNQSLKAYKNSQDQSIAQTGDPKQETNEKKEKDNSASGQENLGIEKEKRDENQNLGKVDNSEGMIVFGYHYEQPVMNQIIFYPFQNLNTMVMPLMYYQNVQY